MRHWFPWHAATRTPVVVGSRFRRAQFGGAIYRVSAIVTPPGHAEHARLSETGGSGDRGSLLIALAELSDERSFIRVAPPAAA